MNKTELLVTPASISHLEDLIVAGADAFLVGEQFFGLRLPGEFTLEEIATARTLTSKQNKKLYVAMNALSITIN